MKRATDEDMKEYFKKWPREKPCKPTVHIGDVHPLPAADLEDKEWPKKVLEEAAEVYSAWEDWRDARDREDEKEERIALHRLVQECGDVIQTCSNLVYASGMGEDMRPVMAEIERRNTARGRYK